MFFRGFTIAYIVNTTACCSYSAIDVFLALEKMASEEDVDNKLSLTSEIKGLSAFGEIDFYSINMIIP